MIIDSKHSKFDFHFIKLINMYNLINNVIKKGEKYAVNEN